MMSPDATTVVGLHEFTTQFTAMGCAGEVIVAGHEGLRDLADSAVWTLHELEGLWSRFLEGSDISRINRSDGRATAVHPATIDLARVGLASWRLTGGRFDPTVGRLLVEAGYDRTFRELTPVSGGVDVSAVLSDGVERLRLRPAVTITGASRAGSPTGTTLPSLVIDDRAGTITVPDGRLLDFGGIGKGFAADRVAAQVMAAGAVGVCVNVGGDVRCAGTSVRNGSPAAWTVDIDTSVAPVGLPSLRLFDGAVAVSSTKVRRWVHDGVVHSHIVDPRNGAQVTSGARSVVVLAGTGWWAEALAKAALIAGDDAIALIARIGEGSMAMYVEEEGRVSMSDGFGPFLAEPTAARTVPFAGADPEPSRARPTRSQAPISQAPISQAPISQAPHSEPATKENLS